MLTISYFDAAVWGTIILAAYTLVMVPLAIRYGTSDKEKK